MAFTTALKTTTLRPRPTPEEMRPLKGRSVWISDLHLDREPNAVSRALFSWLEDDLVRQADDLFILGDLFEYWVGDDDCFAVADQLAQTLATLKPNVWLQHGNRDFLLGTDFAARANAKLLPEAAVINTGNVRVAVQHGDALCWADQRYQAFRAQTRNIEWQQSMLALPLAERIAEAKRLRAASRASQAACTDARSTESAITDVDPDAVTAALDDAKASLLIHGHTHRPAIHRAPPHSNHDPNTRSETTATTDGRDFQPPETGSPSDRWRIVLPDWDRRPGYLLLEVEDSPSSHGGASWGQTLGSTLRFELRDLHHQPY
ncbi:MAG: UDP-2,3-diacylglucosamine diphosphatase [Thioalkalivibrionaceae bacterium]